jgi:hypothetical protein
MATISLVNFALAFSLAHTNDATVPSLLPLTEREAEKAALALMICGSIATEKFTLLSVR